MVKIIFFITLLLINTLHARYICTTDTAFTDWLFQQPVDVNDDTVLVKYADVQSCESQCRQTSTCGAVDTAVFKDIFSQSTDYNETDKSLAEATLQGKIVTSFKINTPLGTVATSLPGFNGSSFVFPTGALSSPSVILSNLVYSSGGVSITTYKLFPYQYSTLDVINTSTISNTDIIDINSSINSNISATSSVVGFEISNDKLIFSTSLNSGDFSWLDNNGTKTIFSETDYALKLVTLGSSHYIEYLFAGITKYAFKDGTSSDLNLIVKSRATLPRYRVKFTIDSSVYEQKSDWTSSSLGSVTQDFQIGLEATIQLSGYSCPLFSINTAIGGDIDNNIFSNSTTCLDNCYIQHNCTDWTENPQCKPTAFDKSYPISDYTGKTVFTKYNISWDCNKTELIQGACLNYSQETVVGAEDWNLSDIGWKSKEFPDAKEALTGVVGLEQFQHLWSGWAGMCEHGTKYDSAWMSDPMTLLSFATMAYKGAFPTDGTSTVVSSSLNEATSGIQESYNNMATAMNEAYTGASNSVSQYFNAGAGTIGQTISSNSASYSIVNGKAVLDGASAVGAGAVDSGGFISNTFTKAQEFYSSVGLDQNVFDATDYSSAVTRGSLLMGAAAVAIAGASPISDSDANIADDFMKAQLGSADASVAAVNYTQCMASIGLSFPNLVGFAVDDNTSASSELLEPWKNIISLSENQLAGLMSATSEEFVRANYMLVDQAGGVGRYFSLSSIGYTQAGQVICGSGNISRAINALNQVASDSSGGVNTQAMAEQAISQALSYLPAPYNLIASIIFKIATSFSNGNACSDETIAQKWGIQQYKTQKGLIGNQCHFIESQCVAKWFWGSCMRQKNDYCCYDQELTRIFVEGAKSQLEKGWSVGQCDDIALSDLKDISFRKCLADESPIENKCFPIDKWNELNSAMQKQMTKGFDASSIVDAATNSMPTREDPWGARIGD